MGSKQLCVYVCTQSKPKHIRTATTITTTPEECVLVFCLSMLRFLLYSKLFPLTLSLIGFCIRYMLYYVLFVFWAHLSHNYSIHLCLTNSFVEILAFLLTTYVYVLFGIPCVSVCMHRVQAVWGNFNAVYCYCCIYISLLAHHSFSCVGFFSSNSIVCIKLHTHTFYAFWMNSFLSIVSISIALLWYMPRFYSRNPFSFLVVVVIIIIIAVCNIHMVPHKSKRLRGKCQRPRAHIERKPT